MHIFGLAFIIYYLKLSDGSGFCVLAPTRKRRAISRDIRQFLNHGGPSREANVSPIEID